MRETISHALRFVPQTPATGVTDTLQLQWTLLNPTQGATQQTYHVTVGPGPTPPPSPTQPPTRRPHAGGGSSSASPRWDSGVVNSTSQGVTLAVSYTNTTQPGPGRIVLAPGRVHVWTVSVAMHPQGFPTKVCTGSFETAPLPEHYPGSSVWIGGGGQLRANKGPATESCARLPCRFVWYQPLCVVLWCATGLLVPREKHGPRITSARAYAAGVGAFYLFVNGERVGRKAGPPLDARP